MKNRVTLFLCAAILLAAGCSDDSSGKTSKPDSNTCSPKCSEGFSCRDGSCVKDDSGTCTPECKTGFSCKNGECIEDDKDNSCDTCNSDEICVNDECKPCPNIVCNGTCCGENQVCHENRCSEKIVDNTCSACADDQFCENNTCKPCPHEICNGICCKADEKCDLFTRECAATDNGAASCNGFYCDETEVCTESGECAIKCNDGRLGCGPLDTCCKENETCVDNKYCRIVCDETHVICGKAQEEICCDEGLVCENDQCLIPCEGTRCGESLEFCCDTEEMVCAFNHCVKPTSTAPCATDDDCDLWSFCDTASHRCLSQSEDTNACIYRPPIAEFKPKVKWHWTNGTGVHGTPIVINLTDDNGDGKIDENDIPEIVTNTNDSQLAALDGKTGIPHAITEKGLFNSCDDIAAADIDNDGEIEVLAPTSGTSKESHGLKAMVLKKQNDGTYKWKEKHFIQATNLTPPASGAYGIDLHPTIADIDSDGHVEIVTTNGIIKADGDWKDFSCKLNIKSSINVWSYYDLFAVVDLDQDGQMEIILNEVYDNQCNVIIPADSKKWNYAAAADLIPDENNPEYPGELKPEIVRVRSGYVSVWKVYKNDGKWTQRMIWEEKQTSTSGGGNPVIADFDGNTQPDIGVAGRTHLTVFNGQTGKIIWASKTQDATSEKTGASVFDFEGDGIAEVVYRDEVKIRIYAGPGAGKDENGKIIDADKDGYMDGKILWEEAKTSGTIIDYPLIADVDNDGRTEIVIASNIKDWTPAGLDVGITVYSDSNDNWVRTRRIWNEHAYHVTNINEDGTVPMPEQANWLNKRLNNYRANTQPSSGFNAPNFVPDGLKASTDQCKKSGTIRLTASVKNAGSLGISIPVSVSFYISDYEYEGKKYSIYLGTVQTTSPLAPDGTTDVIFDWDHNATIDVDGTPVHLDFTGKKAKITYIVDDDHNQHDDYIPFNECHEEDNTGLSDEVTFCESNVM